MPRCRSARGGSGGGRTGALIVGVVLAFAVGAGVAAALTPPARCRGCADAAPRSNLRSALAAAHAYAANHDDSFTGFTPETAARGEPDVVWLGSEKTSSGPREVVIRQANGTILLLVARSSQGEFLCIAEASGGMTYGYGAGDIVERSDCGGSWPSTQPSA